MSHVRLFHRRYQTREQRLIAIQQAAMAASRGYHLSRDMKTLLANLSPAERRLVAIKNNLQVTPGSPVPYRRMRSQSVVCPPPSPEHVQRKVERTRSLSVSETGSRHGQLVRQLTELEEEDRFRTYANQKQMDHGDKLSDEN
ncbi:uncharacterized protein LOC135387346 isoform X2 [Ornithodoros turicata]|uniref:uncharacterized protein LOC135387346 isoform X2 n=1 Tax=Ornithodoros turicata TaxID=34597 RepID=UPI003138D5F5